MAEAPIDPDRKGELPQRVLQVLREAGCPLKTSHLVKKCQVPKKELNQVLYRMKAQSQVTLVEPVTWRLGGPEPSGPQGLAEPGPRPSSRPTEEAAQRCLPNEANIPQSPVPSLTEQQKKIYTLLDTKGPLSALRIAQAVGKKTSKDVNPDLYTLRKWHLLSLEQSSMLWHVHHPEESGKKNQSTEITFQSSSINLFVSNGHFSITHSKEIQIGDNNTMQKYTFSGSIAPSHPPSMVMADDPSPSESEPEILDESPGHMPPGSATTGPADLPAVQMPKPGLPPNGGQKAQVKVCLEDRAISNSKMTVHPAGPDGDHREEAGKPGEDEEADSLRSNSELPGDTARADPGVTSALTSCMEGLALGNEVPTRTEDGAPTEGNSCKASEPAGRGQ
ncbi:Z-DNA-binding protein 1 isoform X1 [Tenrec ecaudatus]|uniref:Z-DNA-binding protein 1 isoform X1 n=1 Tax=Tenrec ecaudatus TaxID=94439 RepID=UPI003F5A89AC